MLWSKFNLSEPVNRAPIVLGIHGEFSDNGGARFHLIANSNFDFCVIRQINIEPRTKANQTEALSPDQIIPGLCLADDPPGNQAGHLNHTEVFTVFSSKENSIVLILHGGFIQICR